MLTRPFNDNSSDYGPDFTPDEEELVNELLAKVATEHAPTQSPASSPHKSVTKTNVADIEDYEDPDPSPARSPKVRGREKPGSPWKQKQKQRTTWQISSPRSSQGTRSSQIPGYGGTASGEVFSSCEFCCLGLVWL